MQTTMSGRWTTPAISLLLGLVFLAAATLGGDPGAGLLMLGVMVVYAGVLLTLGGRSETVGMLAGRPVDERFAALSIHATAAAGVVAILVALGGFVWSIAQGLSGNEFAVVVASGGIAYLVALLWLRLRG